MPSEVESPTGSCFMAADALACAIAHAHGGQGLGALATKGLRVRNGRLT